MELGPVGRHGAMGAMESLYLRDPDGNLVEHWLTIGNCGSVENFPIFFLLSPICTLFAPCENKTPYKSTTYRDFFVVDRGIEPLCQD